MPDRINDRSEFQHGYDFGRFDIKVRGFRCLQDLDHFIASTSSQFAKGIAKAIEEFKAGRS